jgi:oligopeptidase B
VAGAAGCESARYSEFYTLGGIAISPDNTLMAISEDYLSRRQYGVRFRNLETGNWYPEMLDNVSPGCVWVNDSETLYYVRKHATTLLPYQVWRHTVGTPSTQDELIYEETDDTFYVSLSKTSSQHYIIIHLASATTSEVLLLDAELPDAQPLCFLPRRKDHDYSLDHFQHSFYLRSNRDGKNFGLYRTKVRDERRWEVLIPARDNVMLEGFTLFTDWLVVEERQRGLTSLRQINRKTREVTGIAFDDPAYVTWLAYNPEPETSRLRYGYSSMTTPDTLFELDMDTGERRVIKQTEVPGLMPVTIVASICGSARGMAWKCRYRWSTTTNISARGKSVIGLWLRLLWRQHGCRFQQPVKFARSWFCLCHCPHSWRRGTGAAVV